MKLDIEAIDLGQLCDILRELPSAHRLGFVVGKTACRDAVAGALGCSQAEAEALVDTLVARGLLRYCGDVGQDAAPRLWEIAGPG